VSLESTEGWLDLIWFDLIWLYKLGKYIYPETLDVLFAKHELLHVVHELIELCMYVCSKNKLQCQKAQKMIWISVPSTILTVLNPIQNCQE